MLRRSQGSNSSRGIQEIDAISALYCPGLKVMSSPIHRSDDDDQPLDRAAARPAGLGPSFSGDRALVEFNRQLSRTADLVPEPPLALDPKDSGPESQWSMARRFLGLVGIAAAIAWGIVLLPTLRKPATVASQTDSRQAPNDASPAQLADAAPNTGGPPPAQNGFPTVNQPQVVTLIPISKPPAATAPNGPPLATLPAAPVAKSVSAAASAASSSPQPSPDLTAQARATASPVPASPQPQAQPAPASPQPVASVTPSTPSEPLATSARSSPVSAPNSGEITMLLNRGKDFLASGDLSSAQLLFRRAAEAGSAEAAMNLASTYDPHYLAEHNVVGVMGDEEKARAWYQRAIDLGSAEASRRLAELGNK